MNFCWEVFVLRDLCPYLERSGVFFSFSLLSCLPVLLVVSVCFSFFGATRSRDFVFVYFGGGLDSTGMLKLSM